MYNISDCLCNNMCNKKNNIDDLYESVRVEEMHNNISPSTTRTSSPEIEENPIIYTNNRERVINKNIKYTQDGIEYMNGKLEWIFGKPVYVVNLEKYNYYGHIIKIYYELYGDFRIKIGFYDYNKDFFEFTF